MSPSLADDKPILVVEDDADSRESLRELLVNRGYKVICAENGQVALQHIETAEISPTLILLALSMPAMDSSTFLRRIRQRCDLSRGTHPDDERRRFCPHIRYGGGAGQTTRLGDPSLCGETFLW